jgi:hypothetical protein
LEILPRLVSRGNGACGVPIPRAHPKKSAIWSTTLFFAPHRRARDRVFAGRPAPAVASRATRERRPGGSRPLGLTTKRAVWGISSVPVGEPVNLQARPSAHPTGHVSKTDTSHLPVLPHGEAAQGPPLRRTGEVLEASQWSRPRGSS